MLALVPHLNVVQYIGVSSQREPFFIATEYCDFGSLSDYLDSNEEISASTKIKIIKGVAKGLLHLHSNNPIIVHRDLAARNVLLKSVENNGMVPKISDFGMSRFLKRDEVGVTNATTGPVKSMAPECIVHSTYSAKSDCWSFGCLIVEIFTRKELYPTLTGINAATLVAEGKLTPEIPVDAPSFIQHLIKQLSAYDPKDRADMTFVCDNFSIFQNEDIINNNVKLVNFNSNQQI